MRAMHGCLSVSLSVRSSVCLCIEENLSVTEIHHIPDPGTVYLQSLSHTRPSLLWDNLPTILKDTRLTNFRFGQRIISIAMTRAKAYLELPSPKLEPVSVLRAFSLFVVLLLMNHLLCSHMTITSSTLITYWTLQDFIIRLPLSVISLKHSPFKDFLQKENYIEIVMMMKYVLPRAYTASYDVNASL